MTYTWNCKKKLLNELGFGVSSDVYRHIEGCDEREWCLNKATCPDWSILKGCMSEVPKVDGKTGDIDGFVHQANSVLFLEKKSIGVGLSLPLVRAFDTLTKQGNSAIAVWYDEPDASDMKHMVVWGIDGYENKLLVANINDFRIAVRTWWRKNYRGIINPQNPLNVAS